MRMMTNNDLVITDIGRPKHSVVDVKEEVGIVVVDEKVGEP